MTCTNIQELLSAYIDNVLTEQEQKMVFQHLQECPECRKQELELRTIINQLEQIEDIPLPKEFDDRLHKALCAEGEKIKKQGLIFIEPSSKINKKRLSTRRIASIAAVFLVGLFSVLLYNDNLDELTNTNDAAMINQLSNSLPSEAGIEPEAKAIAEDSAMQESINQDSTDQAAGNLNKVLNEPVQKQELLNENEASAQILSDSENAQLKASEPAEARMLMAGPAAAPLEVPDQYIKQLKVLLKNDFEINNYSYEEETDMWFIYITVTTINDGKETKENTAYCGQDGKLWRKEL